MAERDGLNVGTTIMFSAPLVDWAAWFMQRTLPLMIRSWEFAISKKSNMVDKKKNFFMVKVLMVSNALHFNEWRERINHASSRGWIAKNAFQSY